MITTKNTLPSQKSVKEAIKLYAITWDIKKFEVKEKAYVINLESSGYESKITISKLKKSIDVKIRGGLSNSDNLYAELHELCGLPLGPKMRE